MSVGNPDSKYAYNPDQLDIDIAKNKERVENDYKDFKDWMREHKMTPERVRPMFMRFIQEYWEGQYANTD